jgi:hypothetical protein
VIAIRFQVDRGDLPDQVRKLFWGEVAGGLVADGRRDVRVGDAQQRRGAQMTAAARIFSSLMDLCVTGRCAVSSSAIKR